MRALTLSFALACSVGCNGRVPSSAARPPAADADNPGAAAGVKVSIQGVRIGKPVAVTVDGERLEADTPCLLVRVRLLNTNPAGRIMYHSWATLRFGKPVPRLKDEFGDTYRPVGSGTRVLEGQCGPTEVLQPGKPVQDLLVFDAPKEKARSLTLILPAANYGGEGELTFTLPTPR